MKNNLESSRGLIALVLNAHLPYVRHPEYNRFLEVMDLLQTQPKTYLPLLRVFRGLEKDEVPGIFLFLTLAIIV